MIDHFEDFIIGNRAIKQNRIPMALVHVEVIEVYRLLLQGSL